jgi:hypothetical protein
VTEEKAEILVIIYFAERKLCQSSIFIPKYFHKKEAKPYEEISR